jgi:hypothetical protein
MVTVEVTGPLEGVTLAGLKEQVEYAGSPEQERVVAELKPLEGVMVMTAVVEPPGATVAEGGFAATAKPAAGAVMVIVCAEEVPVE